MSIFSHVEMAPRDPILGLTEAFNADQRKEKVNLGVGVYTNNDGKIPLLRAVQEAELEVVEQKSPRGYLPIDGLAVYNQAVQKLLFGADSAAVKDGRVATAQALGGTGGLRIGADLLKRFFPESTVAISDPSWENHRALFEAAGFQIKTYGYYSADTKGLNFAAMTESLKSFAPRTIVVLHACCHNPTGVDLSLDQWKEVLAIVQKGQLIPFFDLAYQGFSEGLDKDAASIRLFADAGVNFVVSSSFSKSFSLYGERVGALTIVSSSKEESARVVSQLKRLIRTNYSNPSTHGAKLVSTVLNNEKLRALWEQELGEMRDRIRTMRKDLVDKLKAAGASRDFSFVVKQNGMFSFSGLSTAQVDRLREEFGIYAVSSGRICVAALNTKNIDAVVNAIAKVL